MRQQTLTVTIPDVLLDLLRENKEKTGKSYGSQVREALRDYFSMPDDKSEKKTSDSVLSL